MNSKLILAAAAAVVAISTAGAASATVGVATYTGKVTANGNNTSAPGAFGAVGGDTFTAVFDFDTSLGYDRLEPGFEEVTYGGTSNGFTPPITSATLTIGGVTLSFGAQKYANAQIFNHAPIDDEILFGVTGADNSQLFLWFATAPGTMGHDDFSQSFSVGPSGPDAPGGVPNDNWLGNSGFFHLGNGESVTLAADHLTVDIQGGAVPEPATWGLMLLGFGGAGALLRRRRAQFAA